MPAGSGASRTPAIAGRCGVVWGASGEIDADILFPVILRWRQQVRPEVAGPMTSAALEGCSPGANQNRRFADFGNGAGAKSTTVDLVPSPFEARYARASG